MKNLEDMEMELKDALMFINLSNISSLQTGNITIEDVQLIIGTLKIFPHLLKKYSTEEISDIMVSLCESEEDLSQAVNILNNIIKAVK